MTQTRARTKAFTDDKGNRFVFPSLVIYPGRDEPTGSDVILQSMTLSTMLNLTVDQDWFEFDPDHFPHVSMHAQHRSFLHGAATVLMFAGPRFEEARR